jgi:hypothetical protein
MYDTPEFVKQAMAQLVPLYQNAGKSSPVSNFVGPLSARTLRHQQRHQHKRHAVLGGSRTGSGQAGFPHQMCWNTSEALCGLPIYVVRAP